MALASPTEASSASRHRRSGRALALSSSIVAIGTIVTKMTGLGREVAIATRLGVSADLDAFLLALVVPATLIALIAGPLSAVFVPAFVAARHHEGEEGGARLLDGALIAASVLAALVALAAALAATPLLRALGGAVDEERLVLARSLLALLLPTVILQVPIALWSAVLNACDRFALPAAAPAVVPLGATVAVLCAEPGAASQALAIGVSLGTAVQLALLAPAIHRLGWLRAPRWPRASERLVRLAQQLAPLAIGALVLSGMPIIDQAFAARLPTGSLSILAYSEKLGSFVNGTIAMSLATAVLPMFSHEIAAGAWTEASRTLRRSALVAGAVSIPLTVLFWLASHAFASAVFQRGAFGAADALLVGDVQRLYILQIPFFAVGMVFSRFLSAAHRTDLLLVANIVLLVTNIVLDALLVRWIGVGGIALATSLVYALAAGLLFVLCRRVLRAAEGDAAGDPPRP